MRIARKEDELKPPNPDSIKVNCLQELGLHLISGDRIVRSNSGRIGVSH